MNWPCKGLAPAASKDALNMISPAWLARLPVNGLQVFCRLSIHFLSTAVQLKTFMISRLFTRYVRFFFCLYSPYPMIEKLQAIGQNSSSFLRVTLPFLYTRLAGLVLRISLELAF